MASTFAVFAIKDAHFRNLIGSAGAVWLGSLCFKARRAAQLRAAPPPVFPPDTSLVEWGGCAPAEFRCGIELLNDDRTHMAFVVAQLCAEMKMSEPDAVRTMLDIHRKGGILLPTTSPEEASRIAGAVTDAARKENHPLICRAAVVQR